MNERQRKLALSLAKAIMPAGDFERALAVEVRDTGFGFDEFGLEKEAAVLAFGIARVLHKHYFRVQSYGIENVPSTGRALLIANHSGTLPLDAVMIAADIAANMAKPRLMRAMVD
ncbi:MAG: hypothetical protein M5R36_00570 [Deltaproteobacteria bacterium]|nr:hypothetical protein [Deltaproteobacteria bacterium]